MRVIQVTAKVDTNGNSYYSAKIHKVRAKKYFNDYSFTVQENYARAAQLYLDHLATLSPTWGDYKIKDHGLLNEDVEIFTIRRTW
jgi:hypothetical protein